MQAVLDCLIERVPDRKTTYTVYYSMLEGDKMGRVLPTKSRLAKRGMTAFEEVAWKSNKVVQHYDRMFRVILYGCSFCSTFVLNHFMQIHFHIGSGHSSFNTPVDSKQMETIC